MIIIVLIFILMGIMAFLAYCVIVSAPEDENSQILEDEEQMEYLRKWREEHDRL